jgi:hypothetical protein
VLQVPDAELLRKRVRVAGSFIPDAADSHVDVFARFVDVRVDETVVNPAWLDVVGVPVKGLARYCRDR